MAQIRGKLRKALVSLAALSVFVLCVLAIPRSHSISGANRLLNKRDVLPEDECSNVRHIPRADQCEFVKLHCSEDENTFIDYMQVYYCSPYGQRPFLLIMLLLWLLTLFMTLGIAASDFLCPNLGTISSLLGMSESLAGVTFLAFGNGSPDLFSTYSSMKIGSGSLAIGELIGAASFISAVVVGAMALARPFKVARKSFVRDIGFFTAAVLCTMAFISDGKLRRSECILMLIIYMIYVATVVSWHYHYTKKRQAYLSEIRAREFFLDAGQEANVIEDEEVGESSNSVLQDGFDREGFLSLTNSDDASRTSRSPVKSPQTPTANNLSPHPNPHAPHGRSLSPHGRLPDRGRSPLAVERLRTEHTQSRSYSPLDNRSSPIITPVHSHPSSHSHRNVPRIVTHNLDLDEDEEEDRYTGLTSSMRLPTPLHTTHRVHDSAPIRPSLYGALDFRDRINNLNDGEDHHAHNHSDLIHSPLTRRLDTELSPVPSSIEPMWSNVKEVTESAWVVALFPTLTDFWSKSFMGMVSSVITALPVFLLSITIPVVESVVEEPQVPNASEPVSAYSDDASFVSNNTATTNPLLAAESENKVLYNMARRNKILVIVQAMLAPPVINILMLDEVPGVWGTIFCIICSMTLMWLAATNYDRMVQSGQYRFLAFFGFLTSIAWVSHIADVVVGVLKALGAILGISDPVLGLTVFAFGNSLGDLIANTTIAKMGFPMMALSACFGGPLLNVLVGVGVSGLIVTSSPGNAVKNGSYHIEISGTLIISAATLFLTLVITMVMVPLARWHMTKTIGVTIISIWTISTIVNVIFI
ncbi:Sodium/calcium exchanger protein-domain-containing protein [Yarrowia lipolytica]|nr:Putative cation exchanger [Yarrowia lipolytica]RDW40199.1 Sodium/calcium exchanger protein-domain-containing protein [Yarrowia lipolytica]SEI31955.1 YALIA101S02e05996g1_1 [Yarrowia lipolytica]